MGEKYRGYLIITTKWGYDIYKGKGLAGSACTYKEAKYLVDRFSSEDKKDTVKKIGKGILGSIFGGK